MIRVLPKVIPRTQAESDMDKNKYLKARDKIVFRICNEGNEAKHEVVQMLEEEDHGLRNYLADMDIFDWNESPLHMASYSNAVDIVSLLVDDFHFIVDSRVQRNRLSFTPLHFAILNDSTESVRLLLECGADPRLGGEWTGTPFDNANQLADQWARVDEIFVILKSWETKDATSKKLSVFFSVSKETTTNSDFPCRRNKSAKSRNWSSRG